ncbi:chaperone protein DNAj [Lotmaria passim]
MLLLSQLPLATQLQLDPTLVLNGAVADAWVAACSDVRADSAVDGGEALRSPVASATNVNAAGGARCCAKRLMDTHDFFTLSDALDTLTDELKATSSRVIAVLSPPSLMPSVLSASEVDAAKTAAALPLHIGVDDFDTRRDTMQPAVQQAEVHEAAVAFRAAQYRIALDRLLHASSLCMAHELTSSLLHNIAVCYFKLEQWEMCASATQRVESTDTARVYPSLQRLARVYVCLGNSEEAMRLVAAHKNDPSWREEAVAVKAFSDYTNYYATHQYTRARDSLEALLAVFPCGTLEATKARLLSLDNAGAAALYAQEKTLVYPYSVEMHLAAWELTFHAATSADVLRGLLASMQRASIGTAELRFRLLQTRVLRCRDAIEKLTNLAQSQKWSEVAAYATQILHEPFVSDGVTGVIYHDRALALVQLDTSWYDALDDAHRALSYTEKPELRAQILILVARCEEALGRWQDAVDHAEESLHLLRSAATVAFLRGLKERCAQEQKRTLSKSTPTAAAGGADSAEQQQQQSHAESFYDDGTHERASLDVHYQTLSLHNGAAVAEVRKSYRAMAMKWHPDRWSGATPAEIEAAETQFKAVQNAYEKLMQSLT